jgi:hypothetical protein
LLLQDINHSGVQTVIKVTRSTAQASKRTQDSPPKQAANWGNRAKGQPAQGPSHKRAERHSTAAKADPDSGTARHRDTGKQATPRAGKNREQKGPHRGRAGHRPRAKGSTTTNRDHTAGHPGPPPGTADKAKEGHKEPHERRPHPQPPLKPQQGAKAAPKPLPQTKHPPKAQDKSTDPRPRGHPQKTRPTPACAAGSLHQPPRGR